MNFTYRDIKNMSDAEVAELNKTLGKKALKKFLLFHLAKWGLIIGVTRVLRKLSSRTED